MKHNQRKRMLLAGGGIVLFVALLLAWTSGVFSRKPPDEEQIRSLVQNAVNKFEGNDWNALSEMTWPPEKRAEMMKDLNGQGFLRTVVVEGPVEISNVRLDGERATCDVKARGTTKFISQKWSREFAATLSKHDGRWFIEYEPTREAVMAAR